MVRVGILDLVELFADDVVCCGKLGLLSLAALSQLALKRLLLVVVL